MNGLGNATTAMPEQEREITRAINRVQSYREQATAIRSAVGRIADNLLGSEPEGGAQPVEGCSDGDLPQLHFNLEELSRELDALDRQVGRLEIL